MERLVADCETLGSTSWSRTAFPTAEVSVQHEDAWPLSSKSTPPSARVSNIDGFLWVVDEPVRDMLGRRILVTENDVFLTTWVLTLELTGPEFVFHRSRTKRQSPGVSVGFTHARRSLAPKN